MWKGCKREVKEVMNLRKETNRKEQAEMLDKEEEVK